MSDFPYKFRHVSVFKRGNRATPNDPWIMAWVDPIERRRKYETLEADDLAAAHAAKAKSRYIGLVKAGRYSPRKEKIAKGRLTDVFKLLKQFRKTLIDKGDTGDHARVTFRRCRRVLRKIGAETYEDITDDRVTTAIASFRDRRKSKGDGKPPFLGATSRNMHLSAMKNFCHWLKKNHHAAEHLLEHVKKFKGELLVRRRAITPEEVQSLLEAAAKGEAVKGVSGAERRLIYETCIVTGVRANEARQFRVNDFALEVQQPFIHLRAETTKAGKERYQPITGDLADRLRRHLFGRKGEEQAFHVPKETAEMLRHDLEKAKIPYVLDGERFDFHSLRVEHASLSLELGTNIKVVSESMGHADIKTTMAYLKFVRPKMDAKRTAAESVGASVALQKSFPAAPAQHQVKNSA